MYDTSDINRFMANAILYAGFYRAEDAPSVDLPTAVHLQFLELPIVLQPLALDQLRAHAQTGPDSQAQANARLVLEWMSEWDDSRTD